MEKPMLSRREMLKMMGVTAAGTILAACVPSAPAPTAVPTHEAEIQLPEGVEIEGFTPTMSNPPEKVKLVYWWGNNYEPALQFTHEIIARFTLAYPNVEVEPVAGQNCDAFVTAAAAGTPPDLFHTWDCVERMGNWAVRDMIIPLDEYISGSGFPIDDYIQGVMDCCIMDGKVWGMVDTGGVFLLWTRPGDFAEIGKEATDLPADTDELWDWVDQLTTQDSSGNIERLGMTLPTWVWPRFAWISSFGGSLWDAEKGEPTPDHPGVLEALNDLVAQVNYYGVDELDTWSASIGSQGGEQNPWLAGNLTMQVEGDWTGQQIFDFFPDWEFGTDYGAAAPPPAPASKQHGDPAVTFWTWPFVIPAGTANPDWSWELLRFYLSTEYQVNVHSKFKEILVRESMMDDERLWWPAATVARDIVKDGRTLTTMMPMVPVAGEYTNLLGEAFDRIMHLAETPEEGMARVREETLQAMASSSE
ncbi:MAG: extracellular solute-binding protein [Chloroflexi bacterium]|nr:extracellular solute-binding protein [Chloroflexota bacterium]